MSIFWGVHGAVEQIQKCQQSNISFTQLLIWIKIKLSQCMKIMYVCWSIINKVNLKKNNNTVSMLTQQKMHMHEKKIAFFSAL